MVRSAVEMRALVEGANQIAQELVALEIAAKQKAQEVAQAYRLISDKLAPSASLIVQAESRADEVITLANQAIDLAGAYSAVL